MKRILFVCVENSNRSQMAEAFARLVGGDRIEAYSAGSRPSGRVNPRAVEAMREVGYDLSVHRSKTLSESPDPRDMDPEQVAEVRDRIRAQVEELLARLFRAEALPDR